MSATVLSMIFAHLLCNALAQEQPLPPRETHFCSANFEELKIALNPNLSQEAFERLEPVDRAKASVASYRYYRTWLDENPDIVAVMQQSIRPLAKTGSVTRLRQ